MRSYKNIGASDYHRCTNTKVAPGESFTCASEKEEEIIQSEGAIGIRLEEVFPVAEPATPPADTTAGDQQQDNGKASDEETESEAEAEKQEQEKGDVVVNRNGATRRSSNKSSSKSKRR